MECEKLDDFLSQVIFCLNRDNGSRKLSLPFVKVYFENSFKVNAVRSLIEMIQTDVTRVKQKHSDLLSSPQMDESNLILN